MTAPLPFSLPITYGTVSGSPISGYTNAATWNKVYVTLTRAYVRDPPADYPDPNPGNPDPRPRRPIGRSTRKRFRAGPGSSSSPTKPPPS